MGERRVEGVGAFTFRGDRWECIPDAHPESCITLEGEEITASHESRARAICSNWPGVLRRCMAFIESKRRSEGIESTSFTEPTVFIDDDDEWAVFFTVDVEREDPLGVEFEGEMPVSLMAGD